jgi:hypothetical protein
MRIKRKITITITITRRRTRTIKIKGVVGKKCREGRQEMPKGAGKQWKRSEKRPWHRRCSAKPE